VRFMLNSKDLLPALHVIFDSANPKSGVEEKVIHVSHELFHARSRILSTRGMMIVHGTNRALDDIDLLSEQEPLPTILALTFEGPMPLDPRVSDLPHALPQSHGIFYLPDPQLSFHLEKDLIRSVFEVNLTAEYVEELLERYPSLESSVLVSCASSSAVSLHSQTGGLTSTMKTIASQILDSAHHGIARAVYIEAKVLELLSLQIADLYARPSRGRTRSKAQVDRMVEARRLLLSRMNDPPKLSELAHSVGTNEFALKRDFKSVFGTTVYGMLLDHRMETVCSLLLETELTIEKIADIVGYSSPAHLTHAFRRKYGCPPSSVRRKRRHPAS